MFTAGLLSRYSGRDAAADAVLAYIYTLGLWEKRKQEA